MTDDWRLFVIVRQAVSLSCPGNLKTIGTLAGRAGEPDRDRLTACRTNPANEDGCGPARGLFFPV